MASQLPCKKNDSGGFTFYVSLVSQENVKIFQANPTLAAGDAKISIDDGAPANLNTLPTVDADFTKRVKVVLNQAETNGDNLTIIFSDAAGDEWCDLTVNIQTVANQFDELALPGSLMGLANDAITAAKFDESTAFPVKSADAGLTALARPATDEIEAGLTYKNAAKRANAVLDGEVVASGSVGEYKNANGSTETTHTHSASGRTVTH